MPLVLGNQLKETNNKLLNKVQKMEAEVALKEGLPHLYGKKHYAWSHDYVNSTNTMNFLCAANQIGKSSANIRKAITWATSPNLWKKLWPTKPRQFWYFYPSIKVCSEEFAEKWVKEWLPRGEFKTHPQFGWQEDIQQKKIVAIRFNSGVTIYFRSYEQKHANIQTSSVHAVFGDEEMPVEVYNEVIMRIASPTIVGYFHMVFTATIGQEFWREVIEERGVKERFPTAFKRQVSMYDCRKYRDGTPSAWTNEAIELIKMKCRSDAEIQRRVYGKFVIDEGLKYESYRRSENFVAGHKIPEDWLLYSGVDIGSGGSSGHPSAIVFVAVSPNFQKGVVYQGWRGDGVDTTAGDVVLKYRMMAGGRPMVGEYYDWNSKDFFNIQDRLGGSFQRAEKSHEIGEQALNVLFKNKMLVIFDTPELAKLDLELRSIKRETSKTVAKDDFADALRYAIAKIPWDFSCLVPSGISAIPEYSQEQLERMSYRERLSLGLSTEEFRVSLDSYQNEFDEANEAMEYDW